MSDRLAFPIPDSGKWDTPMPALHFYKYLENGGWQNNYLECKRSYLATLGFNKDVHYVNDADAEILKYTANYYFDLNIK